MDWLQWEARPWYESSGSIGGVIFFTQVISERHRGRIWIESKVGSGTTFHFSLRCQ